MLPPELVGAKIVAGIPMVRTRLLLGYSRPLGGTSLTVMVMDATVLPMVFEPVTTNTEEGTIAFGAPLITPVEESRLKPSGSGGNILNEVICPPEPTGVLGVIDDPRL